MNFKKLLVFIIAVLMVFSLSTFGKTKEIKRVGVYPLICVKGGIQTADVLKEQLEKNAENVKVGFEKAGASSLYPGFMAQVRSGAIKETQLPKGQEIPWMAFRVGKKVKVVKDLVWAANKTLDVFVLTVQLDCKDYLLVIPKGCGNITLMDVKNTYPTCDINVTPAKVNIGEKVKVDLSGSKCAVKYEITVYHEGKQVGFKQLTTPVLTLKYDKPGNYSITAKAFNIDGIVSEGNCETKFYINYPPVCDLNVTPKEGYVGDVFKLDASGSTDKDGKVVKADLTINDDKGTEVDKKSLTQDPLIWERQFQKTGHYKISLKVTDDFNAVSSNNCEVEVAVQKRFYAMFEAGPMLAKGTYTGYLFGRAGFAYLLVPEKLSLTVSGGGAIKFSGEAFKNHFLSNVLLNLHIQKLFVGAGLGYSTAVRDATTDENEWGAGLDVVGNFGLDVYKGFNKKASVFGEVRIPLREDLEISEAHQFLLGFRYLF